MQTWSTQWRRLWFSSCISSVMEQTFFCGWIFNLLLITKTTKPSKQTASCVTGGDDTTTYPAPCAGGRDWKCQEGWKISFVAGFLGISVNFFPESIQSWLLLFHCWQKQQHTAKRRSSRREVKLFRPMRFDSWPLPLCCCSLDFFRRTLAVGEDAPEITFTIKREAKQPPVRVVGPITTMI